MLSAHTVLMLIANATLVSLLALVIHELLRPGMMLGWFARILETGIEVIDLATPHAPTWWQRLPLSIYAFLTHSLRECFACLGGQLGVFYWWAYMGWPDELTTWVAMATFLAACILFTYPLNKLKR